VVDREGAVEGQGLAAVANLVFKKAGAPGATTVIAGGGSGRSSNR